MTAVPAEIFGLRIEVVRSARRTAALHIDGGELQVRVPHHVGDARVAAILLRKRAWIRSKVVEFQRSPPPQRNKEWVSGEAFPYLGRNYRLKVQEGYPVGVSLSSGYLRATVRPTEQGELRQGRVQQYLNAWYKSRALERLTEKTARYAAKMGVAPKGIRVRNFKSRWGSCDARGQLVFNWNIIKAPHAIVDYVVVHELCHLVHPNHSKDFWALVQQHCSTFAEHREWLRQRGTRLLSR